MKFLVALLLLATCACDTTSTNVPQQSDLDSIARGIQGNVAKGSHVKCLGALQNPDAYNVLCTVETSYGREWKAQVKWTQSKWKIVKVQSFGLPVKRYKGVKG